jgi:hypothetical protein
MFTTKKHTRIKNGIKLKITVVWKKSTQIQKNTIEDKFFIKHNYKEVSIKKIMKNLSKNSIITFVPSKKTQKKI